jgi:hypothetical protein
MKEKYLVSFLFILLYFQWLFAQNIETHGRYTSSIYAFVREPSVSAISVYQFLCFSTEAKEWNNLSLNVSMRWLNHPLQGQEAWRAYRLSVSANNLFNNLLDFEIGRQFLHAGIPFGSMDGMNITLKPTANLCWQIFGGVESNLFRELKIYELDEATVYGSAITYRRFMNTDLQLAYLQKLRRSKNQWQIVGLNLDNRSLKIVQFLMQVHYDLLNSRLHRLYASARFTPSKKLSFTLLARQQFPQVYGDSYFRIFELNQYTQGALNVNYALTPSCGLTAGLQYFTLEHGSGQRVMAGVNDNHGAINLLYESGDLGDQLSLMFDYGYEIWQNVIVSIGVNYARYRFEEIYEYENQLANTVRLHYNLSKNWKADLEYQWLNNRFSESDNRLLNHIHFIW